MWKILVTLSVCVLVPGAAGSATAGDLREVYERIDRAERASLAGDHRAALAVLSDLEARHQEGYAVRMLWLSRGAIYSRMGDYKAALVSFERLIALSPEIALGHYNRGVVLLATGRAQEALHAFQAAQRIRDDPDIQEGIRAARSRLAETR